MDWIASLPLLFFSIIIHEVSHGLVAYYHGDDTAYLSGRLTLNPLPHIDLFGTVLLPAMCILNHLPLFGWAKPVPVNPYRLRDARWDLVKVAVVGPSSNLVLAFLFAVFFKLSLSTALLPPDFQGLLSGVLRNGVILNLYLAFFNLLPVYPLDGSQALGGLLPTEWLSVYERHMPYGFLIIIVMMMTGILTAILVPAVALSYGILVWMGLML